MSASESLSARLATGRILIAPAIADPLAAVIAESTGIEALEIGGYAMGAQMAVTEPLLSVSDVAECVRRIRAATKLPLIVDGGAGWGEPLHVMHAIRVLETAGANAIHIEDQRYPKRAHYHKGVEEVIASSEMVAKIRAALDARRTPETLIIARTDAMRTGGYEEGIARARVYVEAGADMVMLFPNSLDETIRAPRELPRCRLVYVNSEGNYFDRPVVSAQRLESAGWHVVVNSSACTLAASEALSRALTALQETGMTAADPHEAASQRRHVEMLIGLPAMYAVEENTVTAATSEEVA
jgi:methylisocitrate lyase